MSQLPGCGITRADQRRNPDGPARFGSGRRQGEKRSVRKGIFILIISLCLGALLVFPFKSFALTLGEGLRIIVENGRDVGIAGTAEEQSAEGVAAARSPLLPSVNAFANYTWLTFLPEALFAGTSVPLSQRNYPSYGFSVNQVLYDFGKTYSNLRASEYGLMSRQADTVRIRNAAALEFIVAYLDLLETEKNVLVAKTEVENLNAHLNDTQSLYSEGMITKNDVLQAEVVLAESQQRLINAGNLREVRASRVNSLLMRPLDEEVKAEEVSLRPRDQITLRDAWKLAEADRAEVKVVNAAIKQKEEEMKSYKAEYFPTVYASGGYAFEENKYMVHDDNWSLTAGLNINLFAGGLTRARVRRAEAELRSLELTMAKILDGVKLDVKSSYLELQNAEQKLEVAEKALAQADENLRLQKLRYQEGVATATDLLDAVFLKSRADTNYWSGIYGVKRADARFDYALGRELAGIYGK